MFPGIRTSFLACQTGPPSSSKRKRFQSCCSAAEAGNANDSEIKQAKQKVKVFDPSANGKEDISRAIELAQKSNKQVLVKVGYNQCPWCLKLNQFFKEDQKIDSLLNADYVLVKVNYSKENRNAEAMELLDFPQRFGFPVLVVLDQHGNRIHTQKQCLPV